MQDQAFLGPESGMAIPAEDGGVDLYISTQWLHVDREQVAASLDLPEDKVRLTLAGVGGAFGAREDVSLQIHVCLLALHTGRPVKMVYSREESFFGHVHRHPAWMRYEHGATRDGKLVYVKARILLDGGAYASSSTAVCSNAACFAVGPYAVPNATIDSYVVYTNNPPCGAMRGFGAVQTCFAHESQMDLLAAELGMDPVELRRLNAMQEGTPLPTGQPVNGAAPVAELLELVRRRPLPAEPADGTDRDLRELPGGVSNTTHGEGGAPRRRLRGRVQEHRLLRGLRRLLDRPGAALGGRAASRSSRCTPRPPRSARAWSRCRARSPAPSSASSRSWCCPRTPASARPGRRRPRARRR